MELLQYCWKGNVNSIKMKGKLLFEEEQSFVGTWIWYLLLGITVVAVGGSFLGLVTSDNSEAFIGVIIAAIATGGIIVLFSTSRLYVSIDQENIYYRFPPFLTREKILTKEDIKKMYVRKYRPISEYGGWGYRFRFRSGRAVNVAGNIGLQIVLNNDKKLLIGTQKPEIMEQALRRLKENWGLNG